MFDLEVIHDEIVFFLFSKFFEIEWLYYYC